MSQEVPPFHNMPPRRRTLRPPAASYYIKDDAVRVLVTRSWKAISLGSFERAISPGGY
jgi:hypothetical protein